MKAERVTCAGAGAQERRGVTEDFYSGFNEETLKPADRNSGRLQYRILSTV